MGIETSNLQNFGPSALGANPSVGVGTPVARTPQGDGPRFGEILKEKIQPQESATQPTALDLKFSNHAIDRMRSRGIRFETGDLKRISDAVDKAAQKGSKETLVLTDQAALIVNIKNKTVVTAMDRAMMKENVFTNIDSTVLI